MSLELETLHVEIEGERARLVLDRPAVRNALSRQALRDIVTACGWIEDRGPRVVVVAGEGPSFCGGADLRDLAEALTDTGGDEQERTAAARLGAQAADALEGLSAVTVARLHGHVIGGGCVLALACDLRVAAEGTVFAIPEVEMGIPLGWGGLHRLVRDVGAMRAKDLVMTARRVDAAEAATVGLVTRTVPAGELDAAVDGLVDDLLAKPAPPLSVTKQQVGRISAGQPPAAATEDATTALLEAVGSPRFADDIRAYLGARTRGR